MPTPSPSNVFLGRGAVMFDRHVGGLRNGFKHFGNCDTFALGIETEKLTMKDFTQQTTANYAEVLTSTNVNLSISGFELDAENAAIALLGNTALLSQSAGTVTTETLVPATYTGVKGKFFNTAFVKISAVIVRQGATVLTLGTDYAIFNALAGVIHILPTSPTVVDGTIITIDYTRAVVNAASDIRQVYGAVLAECVGTLQFVSNNATGQNQRLTVWKASLTPNGELGLISEEFGKWTLSGTALNDSAGQYGGSVASPFFTLQDVK